MTSRSMLLVTGVLGALGIAVGAFGAHALPNLLQGLPADEFADRQAWLETGVKYHMYHVAALLAVGIASGKDTSLGRAAISWIVGIAIFSGCLYVMAFTGIKVLGAVVPIGGVAFIVGWLLVAVQALRLPN